MNYIECCFINRLNGSAEIYSLLEKRNDVVVETFSCIGNCFKCQTMFHGIINGDRIEKKTPTELYEEILKTIESKK